MSAKNKLCNGNKRSKLTHPKNKHPFYNTIKYEYSLYLKKNPYKNDSENYLNFINFNSFVKFKRKKIINNIN